MSERVYLDYNATAPAKPEVVEAMAEVLARGGNASSIHQAGRAAIKAVRGDLPVGLSLAISDDVGVGPDSAIERKRRIVYQPFFELARDDDFIGVQTYGRQYIGKEGPVAPPRDAARRANGEEWFPAAIGNTIRYAHQATGRPVLITENGIDADDDGERERFIPAAIASVEQAMRDGVPVLGYIHWSLLDNFEWLRGYGPKFGLVAVDRTSFRRMPKPSAAVLSLIRVKDPRRKRWKS